MSTILIADDHPLILKGLKKLLEGEHEFRVVGSATKGEEAIRLVKHHQPDMLILDLMLPDMNGLEVLKQVKQIAPQTRIVILSLHNDHSYIVEAFRNGAAGYVLKNSATTELVDAVRKVKSGQRYFNSAISQQELDSYLKSSNDTNLEGK